MSKYFLIIVFTIGLYEIVLAQDDRFTVNQTEFLFKVTHPLGFTIGLQSAFYTKKGDSGVFDHSASSFNMIEYGLTYSFLQRRKMNFNIGLNLRKVKYSFFYLYKEENVFELDKFPSYDLTYNFPINMEYLIFSERLISLAIHIGYELQYYRYPNSIPLQQTINNEGSRGEIFLYGDSFEKRFTHGINLGVGMYQKLGKRLLKFEVNYHIHTSTLVYNRLVATDFPDQPDVDHSVNWNGNYVSAKLIFYPFIRRRE